MTTHQIQNHYAYLAQDELVQSLFQTPQTPELQGLAQQFCPIIRFDSNEPFYPIAIGYSVLGPNSQSPSSKHYFGHSTAEGRAFHSVIEYAIWWDWDIGHLYELEHVWVYLDEQHQAIGYEASHHGNFYSLSNEYEPECHGTHPILYAEPGKHAFVSKPRTFRYSNHLGKRRSSVELAGFQTILLNDMFAHTIQTSSIDHSRVYRYLKSKAFEPSWKFTNEYHFQAQQLVPWSALQAWIPQRLSAWLQQLSDNPPPPAPLYIGMRKEPLGGTGHRIDRLASWIGRGIDAIGVKLYSTIDEGIIAAPGPIVYDLEGQAHEIARLSFEELRNLELHSLCPSFTELAQTCYQYRLRFYIEAHDWPTLQQSLELIRRTGLSEYVILGSQHADWLIESKQQLPDIRTLLYVDSEYIDTLALASIAKADIILPAHPIDEQQRMEWQQHGYSIAAWQEWPDAQQYDFLLGSGEPYPQQSGRYYHAICIDCGDTLINEASELKFEGEETAYRGELIPGAYELIKELKRRGYPLALVADGPLATFENLLGHYQLFDDFDVCAISEQVGVKKPDRQIFDHALSQLGIIPDEYDRVIMIGNRLDADIKGANEIGIESVWLNWSPRRSKTPADEKEQPRHTITEPHQFLSLLEQLEHRHKRGQH